MQAIAYLMKIQCLIFERVGGNMREKRFLIIIIISVIMIVLGVIVYGLSSCLHIHYIGLMFVQVVVYGLLYLLISYILDLKAFCIYKEVVLAKLRK